MQPIYPPVIDEIKIIEEIIAIKDALEAMGERVDHSVKAVTDYKDATKTPMAAHKVRAAKKRKQKRKNGGPK